MATVGIHHREAQLAARFATFHARAATRHYNATPRTAVYHAITPHTTHVTEDPAFMPIEFPVRYAPADPERLTLGPENVPAILLRPDAPGPHPAAVLQHGYGSEKSDLLPLGVLLAGYGFVVLLADAWGHGERRHAMGANVSAEASTDHFMTTVRHTIDDMRLAVDDLLLRPDVRADAVLVGGFSMGAICALVSGAEDARVAGIVSIAGSPLPDILEVKRKGASAPSAESRQFALAHDVATYGEALAPRPLLLSHGRNDDMVPVGGTLRLFEALSPYYTATPERLALQLYDHSHHVIETQMRDALAFIAPLFLPDAP